jgi:lipoic acid synthetase
MREHCFQVTVEVLVPDFAGSGGALAMVLATRPDILGHNVETVPRLYPQVRQGADYHRSLTLLAKTKEITPAVITKSGLMLGLGENAREVQGVLRDLRKAGCDMVTLGQYLSPSPRHPPVVRYVRPEEFARWREKALHMGFKSVAAGPLVRSSYKADVFYKDIP